MGGQSKPTGSLTDVSGVWIMLIEGHQVGLELEQDGTAVKGVMLMMGQRVLLAGSYANRELSLVREKTDDEPANPHGQGGNTGGPITARMLDDGTLEGELTTNRGRTRWTGERLQKKLNDRIASFTGATPPRPARRQLSPMPLPDIDRA
jgi:hypothetical protein